MTPTTVFVLLLAIAMVTALLARLVRVPYTVALVLAGLGLGTLHVVAPPHLTKELLFAVFLPGLLFEAAFHLDLGAFRRRWGTITALAIPGVIAAIAFTAIIVASVFRWLKITPGFGVSAALVFGGLIAATDPVAVTALFRTMRAPVELSTLIEGESLLNDGTAVVFLSLILSAVTGGRVSIPGMAGEFVLVAGGGALVGAAIAAGLSALIRQLDDAMIEITLTMIAAYGAFVIAEQFHLSGVIATVVSGMVCGAYARHAAMSKATQAAVTIFWEYVAFALNSVVFLLIGFEVELGGLLQDWAAIAIAYGGMILSRGLVVLGLNLAQSRTADPMPRYWAIVLTWGGLRGALSMVLALALPRNLPQRELLVQLTVGVVLLSLLVQGLTMSPLLQRTKLVASDEAPAH